MRENRNEGPATAGPDSRCPGDPYDAGYAKPPTATRFQRGHSGNTKGRPRKKLSTYALLGKILNERIDVTIGGERRRMTKNEARFRALAARAARGDVSANEELNRQQLMFAGDLQPAAQRLDVGLMRADLSRIAEMSADELDALLADEEAFDHDR